jgi:hypothetical protein
VYPFKAYKLPKVTEKYIERLTRDEIQQFEAVQYIPLTPHFNAQKLFMLAMRMGGARLKICLP